MDSRGHYHCSFPAVETLAAFPAKYSQQILRAKYDDDSQGLYLNPSTSTLRHGLHGTVCMPCRHESGQRGEDPRCSRKDGFQEQTHSIAGPPGDQNVQACEGK